MNTEENFGLTLLDGEELLYAGSPEGTSLVQSQLVASLILCVLTFGVMLPFLPFMWISAHLSFQKHRYFLTTH